MGALTDLQRLITATRFNVVSSNHLVIPWASELEALGAYQHQQFLSRVRQGLQAGNVLAYGHIAVCRHYIILIQTSTVPCTAHECLPQQELKNNSCSELLRRLLLRHPCRIGVGILLFGSAVLLCVAAETSTVSRYSCNM